LYFKHLSPDEAWMQQIARDATDESGGIWISGAYALHDREVLRVVPGDTPVGRHSTDSVAGAQSEFECFCRTLPAIGKTSIVSQS
jgi:hypothetical protein